MYYILLPSLESRTKLIAKLRDRNVNAVFHYVPLHTSVAGIRFGRASGNLEQTIMASDCLLRLPLWLGVDTTSVIEALYQSFRELQPAPFWQ
jgi:dTDP-4-amino-4,6-dideoxygalactose transaminase